MNTNPIIKSVLNYLSMLYPLELDEIEENGAEINSKLKELSTSTSIDLIITYRIIRTLVLPFDKTDAFKRNIIDADNKVLSKSLVHYLIEKISLLILISFCI